MKDSPSLAFIFFVILIACGITYYLGYRDCKNNEKTSYQTIEGKVSEIDTETGIEITGLNTSEFISGSVIVLNSEDFKPRLAKAEESYDINMVIAMVLYQHPDSGIIKIFTRK